MIETSDDRADMLADWDTMSIGSVSISGVFSSDYFEVDFGDVSQASASLTFTLQSSDVTTHNISRGTLMTKDGKTYKVVNIRDDGLGITVLDLELQ